MPLPKPPTGPAAILDDSARGARKPRPASEKLAAKAAGKSTATGPAPNAKPAARPSAQAARPQPSAEPVARSGLRSGPLTGPLAGQPSRPNSAQAPARPSNRTNTRTASASAAAAPSRPLAGAGPASPIPAPAPTPGTPAGHAAAKSATQEGATRNRRRSAVTAREASKLFVLDTNVLMHDPSSLFRFAEHDVYLPMMTLEELDGHKKGMSEVSRNARQVSRSLDALIAAAGAQIEAGLPLAALGNRDASGNLFFQTQSFAAMLPASLPMGKADNQILGVVRALQEQHPGREVVLVSKDINMRIKAHALGLPAEDYFNDQVLEDTDLLYSGILELPADFWDKHGKGVESWQQNGNTLYRITGPLISRLMLNQFVYLEGDTPLTARVREIVGKTAVLQTLKDHGHHRNAVWGVGARNREQNFALNLLLDPEIDFVTLLGQAGTGKTLLALAAGLTQVLESRRYTEIIMTRATVPVGEDIGYLPGTEEEKMQPWMGALEDNLEVLLQGDPAAGEWGRSASTDLVRTRIKVKALSFMRGRTFINKFLIIDEAQNLTPKQMKTLITRAGPGTKVVCLGNIAQIDTPYLTEGSSGLTYVVDRFKGWAHSGHVTLQRGERSRLADFAADAL
ncbi:MAG: PhoH family protein [Betaproteobacteria bacterium]|nr:PhoH family protein [Betaproteobacteria bacterium]